jgi:hypothetical protein
VYNTKVDVTVTGRAYKVTLALRPFLIYCTSPSEFVIPDSSNRAVWQYQQTSSNDGEETWHEMAVEFCLRNISFTLVGFFNML